MKYTALEKAQALELLRSNHTIGGMMKALTLSTKYYALKNKIYDVQSRERVVQNEQDFINDYLNANFETVKRTDRAIIQLVDENGDHYYMYRGAFGQIATMYAFDPEDVFYPEDGFKLGYAQRLAFEIGQVAHVMPIGD